MGFFTEDQKRALSAKLNPARVRRLEKNGKPVMKDGKPVGYVEAWDDIEQANRIFGFDGWSRETLVMEPIFAPVERRNEKGEIIDMVAAYWAKVRITVWSEDGTRCAIREGCGAATSYQKTVGEAVENAIKGAESDASKRAFTTFGNQFGLALYDKSYKNVGYDEPQTMEGAGRRAPIDVGFDSVTVEPVNRAGGHAPAPAPTNSQRALATLDDRPRPNGDGRHAQNGTQNGRGSAPPRSNGGLRY